MSNQHLLILDIGTGNVRVALTTLAGELIVVERDDVHYRPDERYPEALYFDPDQLWEQIDQLTQSVLQQVGGARVQAITASSQREGIVLLDKKGKSLIGLPNHDHRGREWDDTVKNKDHIYERTGRYPTSLFSALKLRAIKEKRPDVWGKMDSFLSISDWAQFKLSGIARYEHSQASETQLYSVKDQCWVEQLADAFDLTIPHWPKLITAGTILGNILAEVADQWNIPRGVPVIVGGADTQLAMKSTRPAVGDIVIVSGTTTPVTKILNNYRVDSKQRTWTNRDIEDGRFVLEANAGVTGLNYQRLKKIFYPNESYATIEKELAQLDRPQCVASLGSLIAKEKKPLVRGGFVFDVPVSHELTRADFTWATLWDIACSIKENYDTLDELSSHTADYVWACSGGMQSVTLRKFISNLIDKELRIRPGYRQASVAGAALLCGDALGEECAEEESEIEKVVPQNRNQYVGLYEQWKGARKKWRSFNQEL